MCLEELLRPMDVSQRRSAATLGWTPANLNELVNGTRCIIVDTALDLVRALGFLLRVRMKPAR
jgi:plasmid maintenance system antidote protein VapI